MTSTHHSWRRDAVLSGLTLLALLLWDATGFDLPVMHLWGNARGFAWREHWFTEGVLHNGGRWLATAVFLALVFNVWRPMPWGQPLMSRAQATWCLVATGLCLVLIPLLKRHSLTSCPWSLAQFGGAARWVSHWVWGQGDGGSGHCFPSGHASAAFSFLAAWFVLRTTHPRVGRWWLMSLLVIGTVFGAAQTLRGAHYPSHTLWTAWICWATTALLWHLSVRVWQAKLQPTHRPEP
jgi:membrane-associated PAP2 superfamily phosphatase